MNLKELRKKQILELCKSFLEDYITNLTKEEIDKINHILATLDEFKQFEELEKILLPIVEKIWNIELNSNEYIVISWNKYADIKPKNIVTFATLSKKDNIVPFCNLTIGTEYQITFDSLIGALFKDGATLVEDINKKGKYTIKVIGDKVINSYNGATRLITPMQLINNKSNNYPSRHNELILDTRLIKEIGPYNINNKKYI